MKATIGRTVIYEGDIKSNGATAHPAMINRVWGDADIVGQSKSCVNIMVFPDCGQPTCRTSVYLFENKAEAEICREAQKSPDMHVCYFPDRV